MSQYSSIIWNNYGTTLLQSSEYPLQFFPRPLHQVQRLFLQDRHSFMVYTQTDNTQDIPLDYTRRDFTISRCLDAEDFNNCLYYNNFNIILI
jgi:hypothetical protein